MKKHYKNNHLKQAFSIIEVAIVIVIIGILIVGIVKGKDLYIAAKASTAKNLTTNSHIVRIKSLASWYESSATDFGLGDKLKDETSLRNWPDISPFGKGLSRSGTALSCLSARNCKYLEDGIANIPVVNLSEGASFTGSTNLSATDNYTIVLVFSFNNRSSNQRILNIGNISINYLSTDSQLSISDGTNSATINNFPPKCQFANNSYVCAVAISKQRTVIDETSDPQIIDISNQLYVNSVVSEAISYSNVANQNLPSFTESATLTIAGPVSADGETPVLNNFSGNFAELILFNDYFSAKEINKLMKEYIAKKYSIAIKEY